MELAEKYRQIKRSNPTIAKLYSSTYESIFENLKFHPADVVIDYGCGSGEIIAEFMAPFVAKVYGLDISSQMINLAKRTNQEWKNTELILGDFTTERLFGHGTKEPIRVDKFVSTFVINYFQDYMTFFRRAHDLLKPGGEIALAIPLQLEQRLVTEVFNTNKWSHYGKNMNPKIATWVYNYDKNKLPTFQKSLAKAGFCVTHHSTKSIEIRLESIDKICELITVWDPVFTSIPEERRDEFLLDLKKHALANLENLTIKTDIFGMSSYVHNVIRVIAKKST